MTAAGAIALAVSVVLVVWQGSFTFGEYAPTSIEQTYLFWAVSTVIFLLMVTLGFMLFRTVVRLYLERRTNQGRIGIKAKMVIGALALTFIPVFFMVLFSISVLNRNLDKWFSRPAEDVQLNLQEISAALEEESRRKAEALAEWFAALPETRQYLDAGSRDNAFFEAACKEHNVGPAYLERGDGRRLPLCPPPSSEAAGKSLVVRVPLRRMADDAAIVLTSRMRVDLTAKQTEIDRHIDEYERLRQSRKATRSTYLLLLGLITLFILFVAMWIALFLARQINVPIAALLEAAGEVRRGRLSHRITAPATDELAVLVNSFNEMTEALETSRRELERRRRFIEAILENVPAGVASVSAAGEIRTVNRALPAILGAARIERARQLSDLFPSEEKSEVEYLLNRARRTGVASRQFEIRERGRIVHLSVTVSAIEERESPRFVVVLEDTTEHLRAQKAAAWREVARRIAHEIKNPLTPIALSAQRIARQVERAAAGDGPPPDEVVRILRECAATVTQEVDSVRLLVNEFASFARFPAAEPEPADLNEVVRNALAVFEGRLDDIELRSDLAPDLPRVMLDRKQFKRVIINLVDNSAEAMADSPVRRLHVATRRVAPDAVEMEVADTGCGVSMEDRERLFLPYFSTKGRGTGLGLAIVSQIVADHGAQIRVEDNTPAGARFVIELAVPPERGEDVAAVAEAAGSAGKAAVE